MDDAYAIRLAKTTLREGYNSGDVNRILSVFSDGLGDLSTGCASVAVPGPGAAGTATRAALCEQAVTSARTASSSASLNFIDWFPRTASVWSLG